MRLSLLALCLVPIAAVAAPHEAGKRPTASAAVTDHELVLRTRAGLLRAEDERNAADPAIASALASPVASVRARAVRALGRIGDPSSVALVSKSLVDRDRDVQREAVFALGEIESPDALSPLMRALDSADAEQRALAAEALSKIAWSPAGKAQAGALVVTRLLQPSAEPDPSVVARTLRVAWRFGGEAPGLVRAIGAAYLRPESEISEAAVFAASRLGDPRLGNVLEMAARDDRPAVRAHAARGLGRLARGKDAAGERTPDRRAILVRRAFDVDPSVRLAGLNALEPFDPIDPVLAQEMLDVSLRSNDPSLQRAALSLAGAWRLEHELPGVARMVQAGARDLFPEAAAALVRIEGSDALPLLSREAASPDWVTRASVAEALAGEGLGDHAGVRELQDRLLSDPDPRVVASALDAAVSSGRPDTGVLLLAHLGAKDPVVRAVAASAVPKAVSETMTKEEAASALRRAWRESAADESKDARLASLEALSELLGADAHADLAAASGDRDWIVRQRARQLLVKSGAPAASIGTAHLGRPLAFYVERAQEEMAAEPRTLRLETERGFVDVALAVADAPLTTFQVSELARTGFYDGLTFHRVVPDFVAQGGCPRGDGWGGPKLHVRCEINRLRYERGAVGMALSGKDTGGSQFFVTLTPQPHLDGGYTIIGYVTPETMPVAASLRRFDRIVSASVWPQRPELAVAMER